MLDAQNKALILRRSGTHHRHPFEADLPGGLLDKGETHEQAIIREIQEETGIVVTAADLVEIYKGKGLHGWQDQSVFLVRLVDVEPEVAISWEHDQFEWVPIEKVPDIPGSIQNKIEKLVKSGALDT